ncbi:MAG: hypothetical protein J6L91_01245 [Clostridia bacterium]|nr:hypothetical protein [Clostridia bacterium]
MKTSTKFVVAAVVFVTLYTAASFIVLSMSGQNISDALTIAFFAFWTTEIVALAKIKINKDKKPKKKKQEETENVG